MMNDAPCPGCLLREMDGALDLWRVVAEYVAMLPEEQKAGEAAYKNRLATCKECAELHQGMCRLCGCFIEARAAKAGQRCPALSPRW